MKTKLRIVQVEWLQLTFAVKCWILFHSFCFDCWTNDSMKHVLYLQIWLWLIFIFVHIFVSLSRVTFATRFAHKWPKISMKNHLDRQQPQNWNGNAQHFLSMTDLMKFNNIEAAKTKMNRTEREWNKKLPFSLPTCAGTQKCPCRVLPTVENMEEKEENENVK